MGEAFFYLQLEFFLLTVKLLCLQSLKALIRRTFLPTTSRNAPTVSKTTQIVNCKQKKLHCKQDTSNCKQKTHPEANPYRGNLFSLCFGSDVRQTAAGTALAPTRFSLAKMTIRDLAPESRHKSLPRKSGVEGRGQLLIFRFTHPSPDRTTWIGVCRRGYRPMPTNPPKSS